MSRSFDVVVVGGGPAGASAARVLAERGKSVVLLDRAQFPRKKLCGGLLTWKSVRTLEKVFGLDETSLQSAGLVNFQSDSYSILLRGKEISRDQGYAPFLLVDRTKFDHHLLMLAEQSGVEVIQSASATHCSPAKGLVATSDKGEFFGKFIIGADGANSKMRRALNGNRDRWYAGLARAVEFHISRDQAPENLRDLAEPQLHVGYNTAGYGWVFPNSEHLCIGMCGLPEEGGACREHFGEMLADLGIDPRAVELKGHPLPYGNWLDTPCKDTLLLAGDAGGFVEPLLGEGIFYALATGRYAGEAVADAIEKKTDPAISYQARLARYIIPELKGSELMRRVFLKSINIVGYRPFSLFMRIAARPLMSMVHGHRSYRFMRPKHWDF